MPLLPQWHLNRVHFGRNTPLVLAQLTKDSDLFLIQLGWGLTWQKVETAFGGAPGHRNAQMRYVDPAGVQLLKEAGYDPNKERIFNSLPEYLRMVSHWPVAAVGIYFTRLFNGLDQHHRTPYIRQPIQEFTWLMPVVNYSLWFGVLVLAWDRRCRVRNVTSTQLLVLLSWVLPCAVACLVAIENRFLMPIHLLLYAVLCFEWQADDLPCALGKRQVVMLGFYVCFVAVCLAFSWSIHQQLALHFV